MVLQINGKRHLAAVRCLLLYKQEGESVAKDWARAFYKSAKWLRCKASYIAKRIKIDGGLCEVCHKAPGYIVHHKIILTEDNIKNPDIALNHKLLSYECKCCHDEHEGHGIKKNKIRLLVSFDSNGQPVPEKLPP